MCNGITVDGRTPDVEVSLRDHCTALLDKALNSHRFTSLTPGIQSFKAQLTPRGDTHMNRSGC